MIEIYSTVIFPTALLNSSFYVLRRKYILYGGGRRLSLSPRPFRTCADQPALKVVFCFQPVRVSNLSFNSWSENPSENNNVSPMIRNRNTAFHSQTIPRSKKQRSRRTKGRLIGEDGEATFLRRGGGLVGGFAIS